MNRRPLAGETPMDPEDAAVVLEAAARAIELEKAGEAQRITEALRGEIDQQSPIT